MEAFISVQTMTVRTLYPPPDILKEYNLALSNGAERIMTMIENQSKHRINLESKVILQQSSESQRGQIFGFILAFLCLGVTTTLALTGHETVAGIVGGSTIIGLVTVFVKGQISQKKNLEKKA